jgi:hypothetical protein
VLHVVLRCVLAAVLIAAAVAKLARREESSAALRTLARVPLWAVAGAEIVLAAGVAAGLDGFAVAAAVFLAAGAVFLFRALRAGRAGAPCGCFGARSKVSRLAVVRAGVLALAFAALPLVPREDPSTDTWLTVGLGLALVLVAALGVAVLALAREVGMLRLAVGPQSALEIPEEGPARGTDSGLLEFFDPRAGAAGFMLRLAVFTSEGCHLCRQLAPSVEFLARDPHVSVATFDEVAHAEHWERLGIPGSPYALVLDPAGRVVAKGTFNSLGQLESLLAGAERRMEPLGA